jgi:hypothetical protein
LRECDGCQCHKCCCQSNGSHVHLLRGGAGWLTPIARCDRSCVDLPGGASCGLSHVTERRFNDLRGSSRGVEFRSKEIGIPVGATTAGSPTVSQVMRLPATGSTKTSPDLSNVRTPEGRRTDEAKQVYRGADHWGALDSLHCHYLICRVNDLSSLFTSVNSPLSM